MKRRIVFLRLQMECRTLAGQTDAEIAAKLVLDRRVMSTYEQMFFNVRDGLDAESWIQREVLDPVREGRLLPDEYVLKRFAYVDGPLAFESFLARSLNAKHRPRTVEEIEECLGKCPKKRVYYLALVALGLERRPADKRTELRLIRYARRMQLGQKNQTEESSKGKGALATSTRAFLAGI